MSVLVSVICATYNHKDFIRQCLDGLVMQETSFEYEILVNDDASTDGTADIVREYAARYPAIVPVLQSKNQYSQGIEISLGILYPMARGKYIAECEGDDYWTDPHKLQKQVDYMEAHPECPMCYTQAKVYNQGLGNFNERHLMGGPYLGYKALLLENPVPTMTCCFRRELLESYVADIHPLEHRWATADYPKWLYFAEKGPLGFLEECTGVYRDKSPASISNPNNYASRLKFLASIYDIRSFYARRNGLWEELGPTILYQHERYCIKEGIHYHQYKAAREYMKTTSSPTLWDRLVFHIRFFWGSLTYRGK